MIAGCGCTRSEIAGHGCPRLSADSTGEVRVDAEIWPGARLVEVVPPGSDVGLVLLPPDSQIPVAVRLATIDADAAHARLRDSGATLHDDEVLHLDGAPPMFALTDPDGNELVYLQE